MFASEFISRIGRSFNGLVYPTNAVEERNGAVWRSTQILNFEINVATDDALFHMDAAAAAKSAQGKGWDRPFQAAHASDLAPGITLFEGAWNSTIIKQDDGVYILEAPISGTYTQGVIDEAKKRYPDVPVKGVFSTSDSWPHTGGVRQCVALGLPVLHSRSESAHPRPHRCGAAHDAAGSSRASSEKCRLEDRLAES